MGGPRARSQASLWGPSVRITLPMDMKRLMVNNRIREIETGCEGFVTYPKVAPEPSMYLPRVRITPLGPAPYWKMVTVPGMCQWMYRRQDGAELSSTDR